MQFTDRQKEIIAIVKDQEPISGEAIAKQFGLSKSTLRSDLALLTMTGILDARPKVGYFYTGLGFDPLLDQKLSEARWQNLWPVQSIFQPRPRFTRPLPPCFSMIMGPCM